MRDIPLDFGEALHALRHGHEVARPSWAAKGLYLRLTHKIYRDDGHTAPYICQITAEGVRTPWCPRHEDLLAGDWLMVSIPEAAHS